MQHCTTPICKFRKATIWGIFRNGFQCWISGFLHHKPSTNFLTVADLRPQGCEFESRPWLLCIVTPLSVPSLRGRLMSTSESWGVNGHTTRGIRPVLQLRPVSGWSSCTSSCAVPWALRLGKGFTFTFFTYCKNRMSVFSFEKLEWWVYQAVKAFQRYAWPFTVHQILTVCATVSQAVVFQQKQTYDRALFTKR